MSPKKKSITVYYRLSTNIPLTILYIFLCWHISAMPSLNITNKWPSHMSVYTDGIWCFPNDQKEAIWKFPNSHLPVLGKKCIWYHGWRCWHSAVPKKSLWIGIAFWHFKAAGIEIKHAGSGWHETSHVAGRWNRSQQAWRLFDALASFIKLATGQELSRLGKACKADEQHKSFG